MIYRDFLRTKNQELEDMMISKLRKDSKYLRDKLDSESHPSSQQLATQQDRPNNETSENNNKAKDSSSIATYNEVDDQKTGQTLAVATDQDIRLVSQDESTQSIDSTSDSGDANQLSGDMEKKNEPKPTATGSTTEVQPDNDVSMEDTTETSKSTNTVTETQASEPDTIYDDSTGTDEKNISTIGTSNDPTRAKHVRFDATHVSRITTDSITDRSGKNAERKVK